MDFVDEVTIHVASGKGGDGIVAFRREKYVPRGGPNGGDGGYGADVVFEASRDINTLIDLRYESRYKGPDGGKGGPNNRNGAHQQPLIIRVPVGTSVFNVDKDSYVADLTYHGQTVVVAKGGRGGRGNAAFTSSTTQTPKFAELGEPGESATLRLELRMLADVGVIGFPNAGKSTLIASVSNARPKIADYPFTTLVPTLGVVRVAPTESFVMADVPGLIEGAHEGAGLGHRFLRHVERTRTLIHMLDCSPLTGRDPVEDYKIIRRELVLHNEALGEVPEIIALNKIDIPEARERAEKCEKDLKVLLSEEGKERIIRMVSTATGEEVQRLIWDAAKIVRESPPPASTVDADVVRIEGPEADYNIKRGPSGEFVIEGRKVEHLVAMTDIENTQALRRLQRRLEGIGVMNALRERGVQDGDTIRVGDLEFEWLDESKIAGDEEAAEQAES